MVHSSQDVRLIDLRCVAPTDLSILSDLMGGFNHACLIILPPCGQPGEYVTNLDSIGSVVSGLARSLGPDATLVTVGEVIDLVEVQSMMPPNMRYHHWVSIKKTTPEFRDQRCLPSHHFGALIHTAYDKPLRHTRTRIAYTYCPACRKTTKDYGGKKHTYHEYGTLMSDVWRDMQCDLSGDLSILVDRFRDLFGVASYKELLVLDCRKGLFQRTLPRQQSVSPVGDRHDDNVRWQWRECVQTLYQESVSEECSGNPSGDPSTGKVDTSVSGFCNRILNGDCLEFLSEIPDDSIDYVFVDPPYNLGKNYTGYSDDLESKKYFDWCDKWISELGRVLKPGRMLTLLNIPLYSIRHFQFMKKVLLFQNWIAWDALAFPVRRIMPAHYSILAFSKGQSRELPGLTEEFDPIPIQGIPGSFDCLEPMGEGYCNRSICIARRRDVGISDRGPLTDLWWDIHRLKHNTRRVDHPTQLPPHLLYRLIAIFTRPQEIVLDCFNGAGTTTLAAHRMGRCYVGIEKSKDYCDIAQNRHKEILRGIDPFRKANRILRAKNSPVPRLPKQKYEVPKKTLQMEVKRIAEELGHLPNREELAGHGRFPIRYYDEYFVSWGEVCAAARTTGMTEEQPSFKGTSSSRPEIQMMLDFDIRGSGE